MRILYLTGREIAYTRNQVLLRSFRRLGVVDVVAPDAGGGILARSLRVLTQSLSRLRSDQYDLVFVGFFGQILMLPVGWLSNPPILFDAFLSTFDTLTGDRGQFSARSIPGKAAWWLDRKSCHQAHEVILDTPEHIDYFRDSLNLPNVSFHALPVGCDEDLFKPHQSTDIPENRGQVTVLYYCSYMPLHGAEFVVQAAGKLNSETGIHFRLIGDGPEYNRSVNLASDLNPGRITFLPPVPLDRLPEEIAAADICLGGHFGLSDKAGRVVPGKIYQMLAMEKPVIAGDVPANRRLLEHNVSAYFSRPGDPDALAEAIRTLAQDRNLRNRLARRGRKVFVETASEEVITTALSEILRRMLS